MKLPRGRVGMSFQHPAWAPTSFFPQIYAGDREAGRGCESRGLGSRTPPTTALALRTAQLIAQGAGRWDRVPWQNPATRPWTLGHSRTASPFSPGIRPRPFRGVTGPTESPPRAALGKTQRPDSKFPESPMVPLPTRLSRLSIFGNVWVGEDGRMPRLPSASPGQDLGASGCCSAFPPRLLL